ncbi:MAG: nicotinate (nicotinamide) nucleotide adenylyltransferase [Balneolaceae bacterium]|nr:nicotinate (nicotinamide) nucleotide adenylyltransferase [Balneolaceae bacterium]
MKKRIGVFGGSFDPVHQGHTHIVENFLRSGVVDEILIILTPDPPHKNSRIQAPFSHRMRMLELAFSGIDLVKVSDLEQSLPKPSYTLQTIRSLKQSHPENTYFLCIGVDSLVNFHKWYCYNELLDEITLLVARRPGYSAESVAKEILDHTIFIINPEMDVSSSDIRSRITNKKAELSAKVEEYIQKHNLY